MPAPIHADWEQVKATAIALQSIKQAAEAHQVPYVAARMRASREAWPVGRRTAKLIVAAKQAHQQAVLQANPKAVTSVTSTSQALVNTLSERKDKSKLNLSKYVVDASEKASKSNGNLKISKLVKDVASIHSSVWPEENTKGDSALTLNLLGGRTAIQVISK